MMRVLLIWLVICPFACAAGQRIATYSPGATQTLIDLGCSPNIVLATRWCPLPGEHSAMRDADVFLPDLEILLKAKPDLVILPRTSNPLWAVQCTKAGLCTLVLNAEAADSVSSDILAIGKATGKLQEAQRMAGLLRARIRLASKSLIVVWGGVMAGPNSFLAEPLEAAGFCSPLAQGTWIPFDWESLAGSRPEVMIWVQPSASDGSLTLSPAKVAELKQVRAVQDLPCVRNGRIYTVNNLGNWLPGSGLKNVVPELFKVRQTLGD